MPNETIRVDDARAQVEAVVASMRGSYLAHIELVGVLTPLELLPGVAVIEAPNRAVFVDGERRPVFVLEYAPTERGQAAAELVAGLLGTGVELVNGSADAMRFALESAIAWQAAAAVLGWPEGGETATTPEDLARTVDALVTELKEVREAHRAALVEATALQRRIERATGTIEDLKRMTSAEEVLDEVADALAATRCGEPAPGGAA